MRAETIIRVQYCGGCNPRYDRVGFVENLKRNYPQICFQTGDTAAADGTLVVCGCAAMCAVTESTLQENALQGNVLQESVLAVCAAEEEKKIEKWLRNMRGSR